MLTALRRAVAPTALALLLGTTGCIKSMLTNGQIEATRQASASFDSIGDYELARSAASAGLVQFEGMHELAPDNEDALFLLVTGWVGYGYAFAEDDMEAAEDKDDDDQVEYHKERARQAYTRAVKYGLELLGHRAKGFEDAKVNAPTLRAWLAKNFDKKEDAENLFWVGYAWLSKTDIDKADPAAVADLFVGVAMLEQSVKLDPTYMHMSGETALASYHARSNIGEMDQAKAMFEDALAKTQHKSLIVLVNYATRYACLKADKPLYEKLLGEVIAAGDVDPSQRLNNTIAKRRAKRFMSRQHEMECGMEVAPAPPPPPPPPEAVNPEEPPKPEVAKPTEVKPAEGKPGEPKKGDAKKPDAKKPDAKAADTKKPGTKPEKP